MRTDTGTHLSSTSIVLSRSFIRYTSNHLFSVCFESAGVLSTEQLSVALNNVLMLRDSIDTMMESKTVALHLDI